MKHYKKLSQYALMLASVATIAGCTKLKEDLNSTLTNNQVSTSLG